jgi:hypothetical protein
MSYELVYDKQFLKVEENGQEKFVPLILAGSNNCYEQGRGIRDRRVRSWWNFTWITDGDGFATLEQMVSKANGERERKIKEIKERNEKNIIEGKTEWNEEYSDESWGYYIGMYINGNRKTSFGNYVGIFKTGAKKAVTVEQLRELTCANVYIETSYYADKDLEKFGKKRVFVSVTTSEQLVEEYRKAEKYLEGTNVRPQISLSGGDEIGKRVRARLFSKQRVQKSPLQVDHYFVVKDFELDNYVVKSKRNGYSYSYGKTYAKKFDKKSKAENYAKRLNKKYNSSNKFVVELVNEKEILYV